MAVKNPRFRCFACRAENEVDLGKYQNIPKENDIVLICGGCGLGNQAEQDRLSESIENDSWLPCLPFEGPEKSLPAGEIITMDGKHLYITANGDRLTREQFILKCGCDPSIIWPKIRPAFTPVKVGKFGRPKIEPIHIGKK